MTSQNSNANLLSTVTQTQTATQVTLETLASLVYHLPTGTVFLFRFLIPLLTNNGKCSNVNKGLSIALVVFCGLSCFFSTFTDSYTDSEGIKRYGIATRTGMWPGSPGENLSAYKLRVGDYVHASFSLLVFDVVALLDSNFMGCFYPSLLSEQPALLMALPPVIGVVAGVIFIVFPNTRQGIGYSYSTEKSDSTSAA